MKKQETIYIMSLANGHFENVVLVHNYVWHMLDGNIGKALSLDTYEVNKIKSKYFK